MYKHFITLFCISSIGFMQSSNAQGFSINTDGSTADASAMLDVKSTTKGILIPRMTKAEKKGIAAPATGLLIYQNSPDSIGFHYYDGTKWNWITSGDATNAWKTIGNTGTNPASDFLGTTDDVPLTIRVNNAKAGYISNTTSDVTSLGYLTLANNTGSSNTAFGSNALRENTIGDNNVAFGSYALISNTSGNFNSALGNYALADNTTGNYNIANGFLSLTHNIDGLGNIANGFTSLASNTSGRFNTGIGFQALFANKTGDYNTAIGTTALLYNDNGVRNTAIGYQSLFNNVTGSNNTAIGENALHDLTAGSNNIAIGSNAQVPSNTADNQVRIGDAAITYAGIQVPWTTTSDKRWKSNITNSQLGLDFINKLRPVSYIRNNDTSKKMEYGFIAQELLEALHTSGVTNTGMISKDATGLYGVRYNDLFAPIVKAIQEQQTTIDALKKQNELISQQNELLQLQINELKKK